MKGRSRPPPPSLHRVIVSVPSAPCDDSGVRLEPADSDGVGAASTFKSRSSRATGEGVREMAQRVAPAGWWQH